MERGGLLRTLLMLAALAGAGCAGTSSAGEAPPVPDCAEDREAPTSRTPGEAVKEERPRHVGGPSALYDEIRYPEAAQQAQLEGTIAMQFTIDRRGRPFDLEVFRMDLRPRNAAANTETLRAGRQALRNEAFRVINELRFEPGRQDGEPVCVGMFVPLRWRLD